MATGTPADRREMHHPTAELGMPVYFVAFFIAWMALGSVSGLFFWLNGKATLKRKALPPFVIGAGFIFVGFLWIFGGPPGFFLIAVPMTTLISFLNIRNINFCDACGATVISQNSFSAPKFCSRCGAELK